MSQSQQPVNSSTLIRLFGKLCKRRLLEKGELVIPYLESPKNLYLVVKGSLRVVISSTDNDEVFCVGHLKPGDIFGEQCLWDEASAPFTTATMQARGDVELFSLTHKVVRKAAQLNSSIYTDLAVHINARLGEMTEKLLQLAFDDLESRCYKSLVEITKLPDALTHPNGMQISLTRIDLAQMVGCNRESAGKALKVLAIKGLVEARGSRIVVMGIRHGSTFQVRALEPVQCV